MLRSVGGAELDPVPGKLFVLDAPSREAAMK